MKVLIVCSGNTCRSPMAAALLAEAARREGLPLEVSSAGLGTLWGLPASQQAQAVMAEAGLDLKGHASQPVTAELLARVDLVLTMTERHKGEILVHWPEMVGKVFTLKEFAGEKGDIADPYGGSLAHYREVAREIERLLPGVLAKLRHQKREEEKNSGERENAMRLALGSDHAGFALKEELKRFLQEEPQARLLAEIKDFGCHTPEPVDYPDIGLAVAQAVARGEYDRGILICGTGIGMAITANKVKGIRAALCHDTFSAAATRAHNDTNILTMGARVIGVGLAQMIVSTWLGTEFSGGRHAQRLAKIAAFENGEVC